ncbi:DNA-binding protein [Aliikangiella marina]|uniref:DNA-binding protein n=1 Tax=Aliikangiella marina TaxID=1712262 RepID=A0A545T4P9_9GAMM|nr:YheV family putative metal-binding protein [Aliikangiella marina]TQV72148.1 DNA-binding protein [Aliikangiella marina]
MRKTQRFIAGASCPSCNELDSLLVDSVDQSIECVECGFTQTAEERDKSNQAESPKVKTAPKKVEISNIIRVNQLKD